MKFGVVIPLADEGPDQLDYSLRHLRAVHRDVPVRVISDGVPHPRYPDICKRYGAVYILGRYLKRIECGGAWWKRTFEEGLKTNQPWFLKIDPDTRFWRKIVSTPDHPVAGSLLRVGEMTEHLQGGAQAFRRDAVDKILRSKQLDHRDLTESASFCPDRDYLKSWPPTGYLSSDYMLMWLLRKCYVKYGDWPEVACRWEVAPANYEKQFALTHPHKLPSCERKNLVPANVPIRIITTCMGRRHHLEKTLPLWLAEPVVEVTVVDWSCPQKTGDWVKKHYPRCRAVTVPGQAKFNLSAARNAGARVTPENGLWAFLDADLIVKPGWAAAVRKHFQPWHYHIAAPLQYSMTGSVILEAQRWREAGGYDETMRGWGCDDLLFYLNLRQVGVRSGSWPGTLAETIPHGNDERTAFYDCKDKWESNRIGAAYYAAKAQKMVRDHRLLTKGECEHLYAEAAKWCAANADPLPGGYPRHHPIEIADRSRNVIESVLPSPPAQPIATVPSTSTIGATMQTISVVNHASFDLGIPLDRLVQLGNDYLKKIVMPIWPGPQTVLVASKQILPKSQAIVLLDDADQDGALGYHEVTPDGYPLTKVFVRTAMADGATATEVFTHELAEMYVDPDCNLSASDAQGKIYALEVCDAVEADRFTLDGYPVSNIVTRAWFEPFHKPGTVRLDYLGLLKTPFELRPGGYISVMNAGDWTQIHGSVERGLDAHRPISNRPNLRRDRHRQAKVMLHASYSK